MGHGSQELVAGVQPLETSAAPLGVVEYRIDQHSEQLADRLAALRRKTAFWHHGARIRGFTLRVWVARILQQHNLRE